MSAALSTLEEERPAEFRLTAKQDKARDVLNSRAVHICLGGGSRSGKTFLLVRNVIVRALKAPESRHAIFRYRFNAIKASIIYDTFPTVMKLCFPDAWNPKWLNKSDWFYTFPNGSEIWFGGLDDKERTEKVLGNEYATIYLNETSQIPWQSRVMVMTRLAQKTGLKLKEYCDLNPTDNTHWTYRMFIEKRDPLERTPLLDEMNYSYYQINPADNKANLAEEYITELEALPEKAKKRFYYGQFSDASDSALWTVELLAQNRKIGKDADELPDMVRITVNVDPSGCKGDEDTRSDEIGITVTGVGTDGDGYLLEDLSGHYSPEEWGRIAVETYKRHMADAVVGETNYGGDMVRATIHAVDSTVAFKEVHATRGKVVRAEPIAALYQRGRIHHVGYYPELEDQMIYMTQSGYQGLKSPDRVDSAIWGFTELFPGIVKKHEKQWMPPKVLAKSRASTYNKNQRPAVSTNKRRY